MLALCAGLCLAGCSKPGSPDSVVTSSAAAKPQRQLHPMYRIIEAPYESNYELTLDAALRTSIYPDALQQICAQWYPEYGAKVADAFLEWRAKNQPVLDELRERSTEVWNRRAGPDIAYVKMVYPHIRKDIINSTMTRFDARPVEEFKARCAGYPALLRQPDWDLARKLEKYLDLIRQGPSATVAAKS
jgi:hypothetical protein